MIEIKITNKEGVVVIKSKHQPQVYYFPPPKRSGYE